jgi:hydroxymethylpyrimidine pyrophosphatase-like HAD family hydrolase
VVFDDPARIPGIRDILHTSLDGRVHLTTSSPDGVEVLPEGVSKAASLAWLLPWLRVTPAELMTIGDGENDRDLVAMAAWGVAMANGDPRTRAAARFVTAGNDEDGVAQAVERWVLT